MKPGWRFFSFSFPQLLKWLKILLQNSLVWKRCPHCQQTVSENVCVSVNSLRSPKHTEQHLNIWDILTPAATARMSSVRPGFSMLSVSLSRTPACLHPLSSPHSIHKQKTQPHLCCPPPILPHPPFPAVTSVRRRAPPWRKYSGAPYPIPALLIPASPVSHDLITCLCIAPCVS